MAKVTIKWVSLPSLIKPPSCIPSYVRTNHYLFIFPARRQFFNSNAMVIVRPLRIPEPDVCAIFKLLQRLRSVEM